MKGSDQKADLGILLKCHIQDLLPFLQSLLHGYLPLLHTDAVNIINVLFER